MGNSRRYNLSILHLNIRHYYNNVTELHQLLQEKTPDILTLNETRLKPQTKVSHPDYNIYRHAQTDNGAQPYL